MMLDSLSRSLISIIWIFAIAISASRAEDFTSTIADLANSSTAFENSTETTALPNTTHEPPMVSQLGGKVVGGSYARPNEFPWMVRLELFYPGDRLARYCGASLLDQQWLLTAAHCVIDEAGRNASFIFAYLGKHNVNVTTERGELRQPAVEIIPHPSFTNWRSDRYNYDVALVKINAAIKYTPVIQPINLPDGICTETYTANTPTPLDGCQEATAAGWGMTGKDEYSPLLKKINLNLKPFSYCIRSYSNDSSHFSEAKLCAGGDLFAQDTCVGDSGGPLMCTIDGKTVQIGVTSYGDAFCSTSGGAPGVYARICTLLDWIRIYVKVQTTTSTSTTTRTPRTTTMRTEVSPLRICRRLPSVRHGFIGGSGNEQGSVRPVVCDAGFEISSGANVVVCINGLWTQHGTCAPIPTTKPAPSCVVPEMPFGYFMPVNEGRLLLGDEYGPGVSIPNLGQMLHICSGGSTFVGLKKMLTCSMGRWLPAIGFCRPPPTTQRTTTPKTTTKRQCADDSLPPLQFAFYEPQSSVGFRYYQCWAGYRLEGVDQLTQFIRCEEGRWSQPLRCVEIATVRMATATPQLKTRTTRSKTTLKPDTVRVRSPGYLAQELFEAARQNNALQVRLLLNQSADIEARDEYQRTPLIVAAEYGSVDVVGVFCRRNAVIEALDNQGFTALMRAANLEHLSVVSLLDDFGAMIDYQEDYQGLTSLIRAVVYNRPKVVSLLLELGAEPRRKSRRTGKTALQYAMESGFQEIVSMMEPY